MNSIKSFFQELFYSIPTLGVMDIVDILVVAFIIYKVMLLIRSTSTARVARSILLLLVMTWLTDVVHMYALNWILTKIIEVGVLSRKLDSRPVAQNISNGSEMPRFAPFAFRIIRAGCIVMKIPINRTATS